MAWDASRPVPWRRLVREWVIFVAIMSAVFLLVLRDDASVGAFAGLIVSGPIYLVVGAVLAKFGYQRATLRSMRAQARQSAAATAAASRPVERTRPAPTRRTSTGPSQHPRKQRR